MMVKEKLSRMANRIRSFYHKEWTLKVIPYHCRSAITCHWKGKYFFAAFLIALCLFAGANYLLSAKVRQAKARAEKLESYVRLLEEKVAKKEQEKKEMVFLAHKKYQVLKKKLDTKEMEINEIWRVMGKSPKSQNSFSRKRKSLAASRGVAASLNPHKVRKNYYQISNTLVRQEDELKSLKDAAKIYRRQKEIEAERLRLCATPSGYPCGGYISSGYGYRGWEFHRGIDIADYYGSPIYASAAGTVVSAGYDGGYGYAIEIVHRNGVSTFYAHCSTILVNYGQRVKKGEMIARMGSSGYSTGPHLHYEVRKCGQAVNPNPYLSSSALADR